MTLPRFMFTVTKVQNDCSWSSCVVSVHWREELPLQREGHNIHDDFAVAILKNSNTVGHVPRDISCYFLQKSGSEMTCIVDVNGDYRLLRTCSLDIPEEAHLGALKRVKLPCARTWAKSGGRAYFRRGDTTVIECSRTLLVTNHK